MKLQEVWFAVICSICAVLAYITFYPLPQAIVWLVFNTLMGDASK